MNERQKYRTYALSQNIYLLSIRQEGQGKDNGYGTQVLALLENEALSVQTYEITYIMEVLKQDVFHPNSHFRPIPLDSRLLRN
jgi:hypothetical protein